MAYENNFKVLNDRMIVDPTLAIFVSIGRVHQEEEGWWVLHISHNPELTSDVLEKIYEWEATDPGQRSQIYPGHSDKTFSFFELMLRKVTEGETLVWELLGSDEEYQKAKLSSLGGKKSYVCPNHKEFLLYVLKNILLLPELRKWNFQRYNKIQLRISAQKFSNLSERNIEEFRNDVIWDEREVEAVV